MTTIPELLTHLRQCVDPASPAIITEAGTQDYGSFLNEINSISRGLLCVGVRKGDIVPLLLSDSPFLLKTILAVAKIGGIFMGISPKLPTMVISDNMRHQEVRLIVGEMPFLRDANGIVPSGANAVDVEELRYLASNDHNRPDVDCNVVTSDPCAIIVTSGTTGSSRGVIHSHGNLLFASRNCADAWDITKQDILMSMIPLMTGATLGSLVFPAILAGASLIIPSRRKDVGFGIKCGATFLMGNPTNFIQMISAIDENGKNGTQLMGRGTITGASIPRGLPAKVANLTGYSLYPHYGMTELLAVTTALDNTGNTVGRPFNGVSIRIEDNEGRQADEGVIGEVLCKSPSMFLGYTSDSAVYRNDGWFKTGDLGCINRNGDLVLSGRSKDCIIRGGNNIYPEEIETIAGRYDGVKECAAVGIPDDVYGECIVLCVVPKNGAELHEERILEFLSGFLPVYKMPKAVMTTDVIPKTYNGKVSRQILKELIA